MYAHIEKNIEDNECERIFKNELIQGIEILCGNIKRRFKECEKRFDEEIKEAIKRLEYRIKDSLAMLEHIGIDRGFNLNFDTDSGIDGTKLAISIGGLGLLLLMPIVGEFALIAGVSLALVGVVKASWNIFNPDYKKSQQKEAVNESLNKACEKIAESVRDNLEIAKKDILEKIEKLKAELNGPVENYKYKKERLKEADKRLGYISNDIKTRSMQ
ncbi:hypothetical protein [Helicobacter pylori]|uniref:hypothetical protein n=1 Tax=Helicobacter pylori TaxID=210 RepID=UPI002965DBE0|nr:hypothetical protein [Helicobacter pylori]MDW3558005.1 hypothetical protein [Helicobacter pylori]